MSDAEFDRQASLIADQIPSLPARDRIAAACRGSGNPVALSWLAEGLHLDESTTVIDLGAGLGGPSAWLHEHFDCPCINVEVSAGAAAAQIFGTPTICGCAEHAPIRSDSVDVALLLGVLSVVAHPAAVLNEAFRVADRLGVLDYCSATCSAVHVGGSTFVLVHPDHPRRGIAAAGRCLRRQVRLARQRRRSLCHAGRPRCDHHHEGVGAPEQRQQQDDRVRRCQALDCEPRLAVPNRLPRGGPLSRP